MSRMFLIVALAWLASCLTAYCRDDDGFIPAVMALTGCRSEEELDGHEVERLAEYYETPLYLNYASRSVLLSSGLLSAYQVAVIADHRALSGDILSYEELSSLDGFGHEFVSALKSFVSLASSSLPGTSSSAPPVIRNTLSVNSGVRNRTAEFLPEGSYSMKYRIDAGGVFEAGISMRSSYEASHFPPETFSFFAAWHGRRLPCRVIAGDYRLRFGQGLALWPGFSMGGIAAPEAFSRKPSGISPYNSYSGEGSFRGIAADFGTGGFSVSVFAAMPGLRDWMDGGEELCPDLFYGANAGWYGMSGQVSLTCYAVSSFMEDDIPSGASPGTLKTYSHFFSTAKCSADARFSFSGTDLFAEVAYDIAGHSPAAIAGAGISVSDGVYAAALLRYYPPGYSAEYSGAVRSGTRCSNEYGGSCALSHSSGAWVGIAGRTGFGSSEKRFRGTLSVDASYSPEPKYGVDTSSFQVKAVASEIIRVSPFFCISMRLSERFRTYGRPFRTDIRTDLKCSFRSWDCNLRLNMLHCDGFSFLSYAEAGYRSDRLTVWLRAGVFRADDWDDRIYAYERDAPGSFSVPAYYGRGCWTALTAGWKFAKGFRLYFRSAFTCYPWQRLAGKDSRPARAELKLQLSVDLFAYASSDVSG